MDFSTKMSLPGERDAISVRPSSRHDFQIAIICALSLEAEMVELMFDRNWTHEGVSLGKAAGDYNIYSLGLIGKHNVVLAFMPRIGSNSAVAVASGLRSTFPDLEIALLVGVCGAPPIHPETGEEIILGDCVVGSEVVQYDFGRQYPNQFRRKKDAPGDSLGCARSEVRSLIERLKTARNRRRMAARLAYHLNTLQEQETLLGIHYPGANQDRLFQADYLHTHHDAKRCMSCVDEIGVCTLDCDTLECEDRFLVQRKRSSVRNGQCHSYVHPEIHFGRFGSANTVMRSGIDRDRLAKQERIASFEMEGSGVCELLPTVIIKAVCDYADSHKSKNWQKYAAAVSASALKAILESIELPDRELFVPEAMSMSLQTSWTEFESLYTDSRIRAIDGRSIEQGLSQLRLPSLLNSNQNTSKEHRTHTETWLFDHAAYQNWILKPGSILWLYGTPWCGKTILSSNVFREIRRTSTCDGRCVISFSFQAEKGERQSAYHLLQAILLQLHQWAQKNHRALGRSLGIRLQNGLPSSFQLLLQLTAQTLSFVGPAYLIVDAMDECRDRKQLLNILSAFVSSSKLSLFATSRQQFAVEVLARDCLPPDSMLAMSAAIVNLDIKKYVHANLQDKNRFGRWFIRPLMLQEIEELLVQKSDSSFRLAASLLEEVETCLDSRMLKASLNSIPKPLVDEYTAMSASISEQYIPYAGRLLQLLLYWPQATRLVEAVDYLAIEPNNTPSFTTHFRMPEPLDVGITCGNLVTISPIARPATRESACIQLAHPSIKQFLGSNAVPKSLQQYLEADRARMELSMASAAYLSSVINILAGRITAGKILLFSEKAISIDFPFLKTALWITWQNGFLSHSKQRTSLAGILRNRNSDFRQVMHDLATEQTNSKHITSTLYESRKLLYCARDSVWETLLEASSIAIRITNTALQTSAVNLSAMLWHVDLVAVQAYTKDARGKRWTILPVPVDIEDCTRLARRVKESRSILIPRRSRSGIDLSDVQMCNEVHVQGLGCLWWAWQSLTWAIRGMMTTSRRKPFSTMEPAPRDQQVSNNLLKPIDLPG